MIFALYSFKFFVLFLLSYKIFVAKDRVVLEGFPFAMVFVLILSRIHLCFYNQELNLDEGQMLTQGLTILSDPLVYKSFDPTTGGPLNSYFLSLFGFLGWAMDYRVAHFAALLMNVLILVLSYQYIIVKISKLKAVIVIYPLFLFLTTTNSFDFLHFSSELIIVLIILALLLLSETAKPAYFFLAGVLIPLGILAKLQGLPILFSFQIILILRIFRSKYLKKSLFIGLLFGNLVSVALFIVAFQYFNVLKEFYFFYFLRNLSFHTSVISFTAVLNSLKVLFFDNFEVIFFLTLSFLPILFFIRSFRFQKQNLLVLIEVGLLMASSLFAIVKSGSNFYHYLFLFFPAVLFVQCYFWEMVNPRLKFDRRFFLLVSLLLMLHFFAFYSLNEKKTFFFNAKNYLRSISPVSREILSRKEIGDRLIVWGWDFSYYIDTQLPQGAHLNHFPYIIKPHKYQKQEIDRFLESLRSKRVRFLVDAVPSSIVWYRNKSELRLENYPEVSKIVRDNYDLIFEDQKIKLYLLKLNSL